MRVTGGAFWSPHRATPKNNKQHLILIDMGRSALWTTICRKASSASRLNVGSWSKRQVNYQQNSLARQMMPKYQRTKHAKGKTHLHPIRHYARLSVPLGAAHLDWGPAYEFLKNYLWKCANQRELITYGNDRRAGPTGPAVQAVWPKARELSGRS